MKHQRPTLSPTRPVTHWPLKTAPRWSLILSLALLLSGGGTHAEPLSALPRADTLATNDDLVVNAIQPGGATWTTKRATVTAAAAALAQTLPPLPQLTLSGTTNVILTATNLQLVSFAAATNAYTVTLAGTVGARGYYKYKGTTPGPDGDVDTYTNSVGDYTLAVNPSFDTKPALEISNAATHTALYQNLNSTTIPSTLLPSGGESPSAYLDYANVTNTRTYFGPSHPTTLLPFSSAWYVDPTNGHDGWHARGDPTRPARTVAAALTDAQAGDLVVLAPGYYHIDTITLKDSVHLAGAGPTTRLISGYTGHIDINHNCTLSDFTTDTSPRAINLFRTNVSFVRLTMYGYSDIFLGGFHRSVVRDCDLHSPGDSVNITGPIEGEDYYTNALYFIGTTIHATGSQYCLRAQYPAYYIFIGGALVSDVSYCVGEFHASGTLVFSGTLLVSPLGHFLHSGAVGRIVTNNCVLFTP